MAARLSLIAIVVAIGLATSELAAQPFIFYRGVVNAASFAPEGLPNGSIARGSIFSIFGRELGPDQGVTVSAFPLGASLAGVSVDVCQDDACVSALPVFVGRGQVNAIMPSNAPLGEVSLRATFDGQAGNFSPATVVETSVGLFAVNSGGFGPGIVQNFVATDNQPLNSTLTSAGSGQVVTLWGTGLGPALNPDNVAPQAGDLPIDVEIFVGEVPVARKLYSGRSPCCSGVDQFVFEVPAEAPTGCYVPVRARAGAVVSNTVTIAVGERNSACRAGDDPFKALVDGERLGVIFLQRSQRLVENSFGEQFPVESDALIATFRQEAASPFYFDPILSPSAPGTCHVYTTRGDLFDRDPLPGTRPRTPLDAGAELSVTTAAGQQTSPAIGAISGFYGSTLGGNVNADRRDETALVLTGPGPFTVAGSGGADIGAFQVQVVAPTQVTWVNRDATEEVSRSRGAILEIGGERSENRMLAVWGGAHDRPSNATTLFACFVDPMASSYTVPPSVLANVPAARERHVESKGWLGLAFASRDSHAEFSTSGINGGVLIFSAMTARTVRYR